MNIKKIIPYIITALIIPTIFGYFIEDGHVLDRLGLKQARDATIDRVIGDKESESVLPSGVVDDGTTINITISNTNEMNMNSSGGNTKIQSIIASSVRESMNIGDTTITYGATNICDKNLATAWVEGVDGDGIGEKVTFYYSETTYIHCCSILSGYAKSNEAFVNNSRVKAVEIELSSGHKYEFTLDDSMSIQVMEFGEYIPCEWISLEVRDIYPGEKYRDTCISELWFE